MSLLTMPPELLAIIIGHLDTHSIYNLYAAGVVCVQGHVTECHFFANALATTRSLETDFFIGVSAYLRVLNVSGVSDLDLPCLLKALTNMTSLTDLDVSYTNINMPDFLEIAAVRPTLKSIAINFTFVESKDRIQEEVLFRVKEIELPRYQQAFQRFENVHFVGKMHARVHGALALLVLRPAVLANLTFTTTGAVEGSQLDARHWDAGMVNVARFQLYFLKIPHRRSLLDTHIYTVMDFNKYEVIIFCSFYKYCQSNGTQKVFATPLLKRMICEHFGVELEVLSAPLDRAALAARLASARCGAGTDYACLFWDVDRTVFDRAFRSTLLKIFKEYFVFNVDETQAPAEHSWCGMTASPHTMDYSTKFEQQQKVKLKILFDKKFKQNVMPNIDSDRDFLKKITHLSLSGAVAGDAAYFKSLLEACCSLETLQLGLGQNTKLTFLQHLKQAKRLKNFLISYSPKRRCPLLAYLSECTSLQNVYLRSFHNTGFDLQPDPAVLLSKFSNLYNFCLHVSLDASEEEIDASYKMVTAELGRIVPRVVLTRGFRPTPYHPYLSVFNRVFQLSPASTHGCNVLNLLSKRQHK